MINGIKEMIASISNIIEILIKSDAECMDDEDVEDDNNNFNSEKYERIEQITKKLRIENDEVINTKNCISDQNNNAHEIILIDDKPNHKDESVHSNCIPHQNEIDTEIIEIVSTPEIIQQSTYISIQNDDDCIFLHDDGDDDDDVNLNNKNSSCASKFKSILEGNILNKTNLIIDRPGSLNLNTIYSADDETKMAIDHIEDANQENFNMNSNKEVTMNDAVNHENQNLENKDKSENDTNNKFIEQNALDLFSLIQKEKTDFDTLMNNNEDCSMADIKDDEKLAHNPNTIETCSNYGFENKLSINIEMNNEIKTVQEKEETKEEHVEDLKNEVDIKGLSLEGNREAFYELKQTSETNTKIVSEVSTTKQEENIKTCKLS